MTEVSPRLVFVGGVGLGEKVDASVVGNETPGGKLIFFFHTKIGLDTRLKSLERLNQNG